MRPTPYIGVTGVTTAEQAQALLDTVPANSKHSIMIGVLVSSKTLTGAKNRFPNRYPAPEQLENIFVGSEGAFNVLHFNTSKAVVEDIVCDLNYAHHLAGRHCHGVQLNIAWPQPELIRRYKKEVGGKIILQCGSKALAEVGMSGAGLAAKLLEYVGLADYVLVDPSGGEGREFDLALALDCFEHLDRFVPNIGYGIAGGLEAANVVRLRPLLKRFSNFSIDVEGRVRDSEDNLNLEAACQFVRAASNVLSSH